MPISRKINTEASGGCCTFPQTETKGGNKAGAKLSSFRFKEKKGKCRIKSQHEYAKTDVRREKKKKKKVLSLSRVALELAGGFLLCWRAKPVVVPWQASGRYCNQNKHAQSCCSNTITVLNSRFYSSGTNIDTPNCNMSHLFSRWGGIKERMEREGGREGEMSVVF